MERPPRKWSPYDWPITGGSGISYTHRKAWGLVMERQKGSILGRERVGGGVES